MREEASKGERKEGVSEGGSIGERREGVRGMGREKL